METTFTVVHGGVESVPADLLLLKHAQGFYGADEYIAELLSRTTGISRDTLAVPAGEFVIKETAGFLAAHHVMFLGTEDLFEFGYEAMRRFARQAIRFLADGGLSVRRLSTTIHGVGYGLDAEEALSELVLGFAEEPKFSERIGLQEIIFVERNERRAQTLKAALPKIVNPLRISPSSETAGSRAAGRGAASAALPKLPPSTSEPAEGHAVLEKRHVFVAMPFSEEFEDVYQFGIYAPVRACGFICEKTSESAFVGDIMARVRDKIETAHLVIAELSGGRPNVYLEVGYAWGKGVPVILLARRGETLHFDVTLHRCIYYESIRQLARDLEKLLSGLAELKS
jgi:hypothetical protein